MTGIDFYVLPSDSLHRRLEFACQLTEKAVNSGHQVLLAVDDLSTAEQLDQLLWTVKPESFLPHRIIDTTPQTDTRLKIEITHGDTCLDHHDVLIAMCAEIPVFFSRFQRYAEVVVQKADILAQSREHWSFFQHRGYPLQHRKLGG